MKPANDNHRSSHANPVLESLDRGKLLQPGGVTNAAAADALRSFQHLLDIDEEGDTQIAWNDYSRRFAPEGMSIEPRLMRHSDGTLRWRARTPFRPSRRSELAASDAWRRTQYTGAAFPYLPRPTELFLAGKSTPGQRGQRYAMPPVDEPLSLRMDVASLLDRLAWSLGPLYESVYMAAAGCTLEQIGKAAGYSGKRAEAVGRDRLRLALPVLARVLGTELDELSLSAA